MHKKIISAMLAFGLVFSVSARSYAEPSLNDQLNSSQSKYDQSQKDIETAKNKVSGVQAQVEKLDSQIHQGMKELDDINKQIANKETDINKAEDAIKKAEADIKSEQDLYDKRIRAMYMSGSEGYINVILESNGLNDLMSKIETVQRITELDKKIVSELNDKKKVVQQKKDVLVADQNKLNGLKSDSQKKLDALNKQKADQVPLIAKANDEQQAAIEANSTAKAQIAAINKKLADLKAAQEAAAKAAAKTAAKSQSNTSSSYSSIIVPTNYSTDNLVTYAETFLGLPYVWGGTTPAGFDCSGFVQYVYRHFGITIPRVSQDQYRVGTSVSQSNLQPGDLVFFAGSDGSMSSPGHVGMYVGGGTMIESPYTGASIRIVPMSRRDYVGAKRIR